MNEVVKYPALYAALAAFLYCLLYVTSTIALGTDIVKHIVDYGVLSVSLFFFWKWFPNSFDAFKLGGIERKARLSMGLSLTALALAAQRLWIIIISQVGVAEWINREAISSFFGSWFIGSILLCLSVDISDEDLAPQIKWYFRFILICIGAVLTFVALQLVW